MVRTIAKVGCALGITGGITALAILLADETGHHLKEVNKKLSKKPMRG